MTDKNSKKAQILLKIGIQRYFVTVFIR